MKLRHRAAGFHHILHIFLCDRYVVFSELLYDFLRECRASRNLCQRLHVQIIGITCYAAAAFYQSRLNFIDNRNHRFQLRTARLVSFFLKFGKIFVRHNIRHYYHIVFLRGNVRLPRILHNIFRGLSLTFISGVIHNCARNV